MKRRMLPALMALSLCLTIACFAGTALAQDAAKHSVVRVFVEDDFGVRSGSETIDGGIQKTGSAVAVGKPGEKPVYFVTNLHVVAAASQADLADGYTFIDEGTGIANRVFILTGDIQSRVAASVVAVSSRTDLAILKTVSPIENRVPITLRPFKENELGSETVYAIGFPGVADMVDMSGVELRSSISDMSISMGIINRVVSHEVSHQGEQIQIDAEISGGSSGGALVDNRGRLLGINTSGFSGVQVNYAVSVNEVIRLLEDERISFSTSGGGAAVYIIIAVVLVLGAAVWYLFLQKNPIIKLKTPLFTKKKPSKSKREARYLVADSGALAGKRYRLERSLVLGRDPSKCQVVLSKDTPKVSAVHCSLRYDGRQVTVIDEKSTCGTMIDGNKIPAGKPVVLHRGHKLSLGSQSQTFTLHS